MMHAASLSSWRLQALLNVLSDGDPHSTKEIARKSEVLAISACVSELRQNGADIVCDPDVIVVDSSHADGMLTLRFEQGRAIPLLRTAIPYLSFSGSVWTDHTDAPTVWAD